MKKVLRNSLCLILSVIALLSVGLFLSITSVKAEKEKSVEIKYCNLAFEDNVYILYAVDSLNIENKEDIKVLIWREYQDSYDYSTEDDVLNFYDYIVINQKTYSMFVYDKLSAKEMGDDVYARPYYNDNGVAVYGEVKKYSILQYAYNITKNEKSDPQLKTMVADMMTYGAAASVYYNYKSDVLKSDTRFLSVISNATINVDIDEDGYWVLNGQKTDKLAKGEKGEDGKDGREIKSAEIDKDGNLIITYKDDTAENLGKIKDNSKCEHEYSDYMVTKLGNDVYKKEYYCVKCFETKSELFFDSSSKNKPILVNGEELNPKNESVYYFNSTEELTKYVGFPIALNGLELKDCEGYWNIELSVNSFDIYIDDNMSILGIMYAYSEIYHPFGSGNYTIGEMLTYTIENGLKHYVLTDLGKVVANAQLKIPTKCIIVTKVLEAPAETTPAIVNGVEIDPLTNTQYYFNSKSTETTTHGGFQIDLNAMGLKDCEGYWNVELSVNSFDIYIDSSMSILGIMLWDKLGERYAPFGSGKRTIDQMLTYTLENGLKHYTLSDIGTQVARSQLQNAKKCIIVTKVLDDASENTTAETTPAIVNGVEINPITNFQYYFNSKSKEMVKQDGFSIDLNAMGLKNCEGYWNVELSVKSFDVSIDNTMEILGIMLYDELGNRYAPFGSGKATIDEMLTYKIENGLKHYVLTDLGVKVAKSQLLIPTKCIIVTKVLDDSSEILEYNRFENE